MMKTAKLFFSTKALSFRKKNFFKYQKRRESVNPGIDNRLRKVNEYDDENSFDEMESLKEDDFLEPDFLQVGKSYDIHRREQEVRKLKTKTQITLNKFLKEVEPSFLTFAEKEQIKLLHRNNPEEWTIDRLSESFPELPENIKKVLKTNFNVKSKKYVLQHDENVADNWIAFREGELSVSEKLTKHLQKFNDRKIILTNKDKLAEQYVKPKVKLPKPMSTFYSKIAEKLLLNGTAIESNVNRNATNNETNEKINDKSILQTNKKNEFFQEFNNAKNLKFSNKTHDSEIILSPREEETSLISKDLNEHKSVHRRVTFDEFLKRNVGRTEKSNSVEDIVLKKVYKAEMEKKILFQSKLLYPSGESKDEIDSTIEVNEKFSKIPETLQMKKTDLELTDSKKYENNYVPALKTQISPMVKEKSYEISLGSNKSSLDTYVKEWQKNNIDNVEVADYIKIPRNRYKQGMTYRVKDSFYDDDGEFLYRVPGLLNLK